MTTTGSAEKRDRDTPNGHGHNQADDEHGNDPSLAPRKSGPAAEQLPVVRNAKPLERPEPPARPPCAGELLSNRVAAPVLSTHGSLNIPPEGFAFDTCRAHT
jgi:hypothetical protein